MRLPACLKKYAHLIEEVSDERDTDDGYWVYLKPGYWHPPGEVHCVHEDTPRECAAEMKYVEKCNRDCCKGD